MNLAVDQIVAELVAFGGTVVVGSVAGAVPGTFTFNPTAIGSVTTSPHALASWTPAGPGGITGLPPGNILASSSSAVAVGAVFSGHDMLGGQGRMTILMDINWFAGSQAERLSIIENIQKYLEAEDYSADFDRDGDVDGTDLARWEGSYDTNGMADADLDGDSDGADFLAWQQQYGSGLPLLSPHTAVPEPAAAVMFLTGLLAIFIRYDRVIISRALWDVRSFSPELSCDSRF